MHLYRHSLILVVLSFGIALVQCQTTFQPSASGTAPSFQSKVNTVVVDVVVTDEHDEFVTGLDKKDFQVLENNKIQTVSVFEEHKAGLQPTLAKLPPIASGVYTNIPPVTIGDSVNVVLLDAVNTQSWDQSAVHSQLVKYLTNIPRGTSLAAFTLNSRLHMLSGVTTDASALLAALTDVKAGGGPHQSLLLSSTNEMNPDDWQNGEMQRMATARETELADFLMRRTSYAELQQLRMDGRVGVTLQALEQLARYLVGIRGRKNVIWFSGSFPVIVFSNPVMLDPFFDATRSYMGELKRVAGLLAAAQVAIYPVQAEGLVQNSGFDADASAISQTRAVSSTPDRSRARNRDSNILTMEMLAVDTGGRAFYNTNGIGDAFGRAIDHGARYYTLTYIPTNKKMDGNYRQIKVKLSTGKYKVSHRQGYFSDKAQAKTESDQPIGDPLLPLMARGLPNLAQIIYKVSAFLSNPQPTGAAARAGDNSDMKGPFTRYDVEFAIATENLKLDPTADDLHRGDIEVMLVAYARDGVVLNLLAKKPMLELKTKALTTAQASEVQLRYQIDVPQNELRKGGVCLRTGIYDKKSGFAGTMEIPLRFAPGTAPETTSK
jgi:VWFA-related protein